MAWERRKRSSAKNPRVVTNLTTRIGLALDDSTQSPAFLLNSIEWRTTHHHLPALHICKHISTSTDCRTGVYGMRDLVRYRVGFVCERARVCPRFGSPCVFRMQVSRKVVTVHHKHQIDVQMAIRRCTVCGGGHTAPAMAMGCDDRCDAFADDRAGERQERISQRNAIETQCMEDR